MGYVRTGGLSTASRRRRRRTALVLTALVTLLLVVFLYAAAYYQGWLGQDAADPVADDTAGTATATAEPLAPPEITVNVYNANGAPGLAAGTAEALTARGFVVADIADDDVSIEGPAVIRHGPAGAQAARALQQSLVPGAELVPDDREGEEIDLVLGDAWEALPEAEDATEGEG